MGVVFLSDVLNLFELLQLIRQYAESPKSPDKKLIDLRSVCLDACLLVRGKALLQIVFVLEGPIPFEVLVDIEVESEKHFNLPLLIDLYAD